MSTYLILILGCLFCVSSSTTSNEIPTFAISCGNTPLNTLPKYVRPMGTPEFQKLLSSFWNKDTKVVIVLEDELSLEDFTGKDSDGHSSFKLFENAKNRRFFPSVDKPKKAIELLSTNGFSVKTYNDNIYVNSSQKMIALVDLNENNHNNDESRRSMLIRHNNYVSRIFNDLCEQYVNVILVLSGKSNPWIEKSKTSKAHKLVTRHLLAVDEASPKFKIVDLKGKSLIYSASYPTLSIDNGPFLQLKETVPDVFVDDSRDSLLKVAKTFLVNETKIVLRFRFERTTFTWELKSIEYESMGSNIFLMPQSFIGAQKGLSYFSEGPVIFSGNSIVLKFNDKFQVQPWLISTPQSAKFSDPQEQDSFFTPPILAGLFVTALMLFIVAWGTIMIMDIKTMDRFDDPKGKTISINVVE